MRFLHCSDIHVLGDYQRPSVFALGWRRMPALAELKLFGRGRYFADSPKTIRTIVEDFTRHHADHLIVSGDLTGYALEEEFEGALQALGPIAADKRRCTVIPGNHDTYTPGALADQRFERRFGHLLESDLPQYTREGPYPFVRLLDDGAAVVGLLSARIGLVPGFSFGIIGPKQLDGLQALINDPALQNRAVLVVVHHAPLTKEGKPDKPFHGLVDARKLFEIVRGPQYAVLHGHIHHRYHHEATADRPHEFGAGSSTQQGREGYWLIDVRDGKFVGSQMRRPGE
jgi:3',5'-cyclic AMP phosphodiesterase CpdA